MVKGTIAQAAGVRFTKEDADAFGKRTHELEQAERVSAEDVSNISLT